MKSFILIALMFLASESFASDTFICRQTESTAAVQKELKVTFVKDLTDRAEYNNEFDFVNKVIVEIRDVKNGVRTVVKKFTAIAKSADVIYQIDSPDFSFIRYYDEEDQDHMRIKNKEYRLNCQSI